MNNAPRSNNALRDNVTIIKRVRSRVNDVSDVYYVRA